MAQPPVDRGNCLMKALSFRNLVLYVLRSLHAKLHATDVPSFYLLVEGRPIGIIPHSNHLVVGCVL